MSTRTQHSSAKPSYHNLPMIWTSESVIIEADRLGIRHTVIITDSVMLYRFGTEYSRDFTCHGITEAVSFLRGAEMMRDLYDGR